MVDNREQFDFDDLWWPDLWPDLKNDRSTFVTILDELSNAAWGMSLRSSGAELDGVGRKNVQSDRIDQTATNNGVPMKSQSDMDTAGFS